MLRPSFVPSKPPSGFPRISISESAVNTAISRSDTEGSGLVGPEPIGPGLGGFPRIGNSVALVQKRQGERQDRPVLDEQTRQRVELAVPVRYRALPDRKSVV